MTGVDSIIIAGRVWGLFLAAYGAFSDIKRGRISNSVIILGLCLGTIDLCANIIAGSWGDTGIYIGGLIIPMVALWPLFQLRVMGAGDIKLLMVLGFLVGLKGILGCMFWTFMWGGIIGIMVLFRKKLVLGEKGLTKMPFAVAILFGYVNWIVWSGYEWG